MLFNILAVLVALSLPALLVIEEVNSWRKSHKAPEPQGTVAPTVVPEPAPRRQHGLLRAPERKIA